MWELREYKKVVSNFYESVDEDMQAAIDQRLDQLQRLGNLAREPVSKFLRDTNRLFETKIRAGRRQVRFLYFFQPGKKVVFVVAIKKDQRTLSGAAIKRAEKIKRDIERNPENNYVDDYLH